METTWYSDFKALILSPFKQGIPQIVAYGSCMKGFYATAAVSFILTLLTTFIPALVISIMQLHHTDYGRIIVMNANGSAAYTLAFNLFGTFLGLAINAYLVSWIANKFDAQTTYHEVLKVNWYSYAYGQLLMLVLTLFIIPFFLLFVVYGFVRQDGPFYLYLAMGILIVNMIGISVWTWWVSLNLLSQQINKPKLSTFGITLLAGLIPFIIIGSIAALIFFIVISNIHSSGLF